MTLKTDNGKIAYLTIITAIVVTTFILLTVYCDNTIMRGVILARDSEGEVYIVDPRCSCGKCDSDIWYFYGDDGSLKKVVTPLQSNYTFIKVRFNKNHYNRKTKTFTFGSYSETFNRVFSKDFHMNSVDANGFKVYEELDSGYERKRWLSILYWLIWGILSGLFFLLPLMHIRPSKDFFSELMKYASYADEYESTNLSFKDDKLQVYLAVSPEEVHFLEVYYKEDRVANDVYVLSDGTLKHIIKDEFYWIKRATKSILPTFKNKMVDSKIERIF